MSDRAFLEAQYALLVLRQAKISSREVAIKLLQDLARQSEYFGSSNPVMAIECGAVVAAIRTQAREIRPTADAPEALGRNAFATSNNLTFFACRRSSPAATSSAFSAAAESVRASISAGGSSHLDQEVYCRCWDHAAHSFSCAANASLSPKSEDVMRGFNGAEL
ncbi:hypothetical protein V1281_007138 [Nitrobacteraceae bacterium AZCC 2161]